MITKTAAQWGLIVENLQGGRIRFSTGTMERRAMLLGSWLEDTIWDVTTNEELFEDADLLTLDFADDWDAVVMIAQAEQGY